MALSRVCGRSSKIAVAQCRSFFSLSPPSSPSHHHLYFSLLSNRFHPRSDISMKVPALHHHGLRNMLAFPHCGMSTSASPEKDQGTNKTTNGKVDAANQAEEAATSDVKDSQETQQTDSVGDMDDLSKEDLVKLVLEKEQVMEQNQKEFAEWKDKFLRSYAEMENVMERTRRDAENSKKFAVQSFAKSLLDVADNLGRASSVTKESFNKIDASNDTVGAVPLLKTLLEGVEITEKQLAEVFRKSGIEKYDPTNEQFDPNRHNAVFQVPDSSKPPGTVAVVLKTGYMLHDRIIRPAEVGVAVAVENNEANA